MVSTGGYFARCSAAPAKMLTLRIQEAPYCRLQAARVPKLAVPDCQHLPAPFLNASLLRLSRALFPSSFGLQKSSLHFGNRAIEHGE